ncbi:hypothetical protein GCM10028778_25470 [Barrientosiimonas marina]
MIVSINVYDKQNDAYDEENETGGNNDIDTKHHETEKLVNGYNEVLETWIMKNEISPTGYQNFRIITDEVYSQRVRVKGEVVDEVIKQELHLAYVKVRNDFRNGVGNLITLCKKADSHRIKEIFEDQYELSFEPHQFDVLQIIEESADVRNAKFDVEIETVSGVTMKGTRVHNTEYYANMLRSGQLSAVIVNYDLPDKTITFRVTVDGSIQLYSNLGDYEILELIEDLLNLE